MFRSEIFFLSVSRIPYKVPTTQNMTMYNINVEISQFLFDDWITSIDIGKLINKTKEDKIPFDNT